MHGCGSKDAYSCAWKTARGCGPSFAIGLLALLASVGGRRPYLDILSPTPLEIIWGLDGIQLSVAYSGDGSLDLTLNESDALPFVLSSNIEDDDGDRVVQVYTLTLPEGRHHAAIALRAGAHSMRIAKVVFFASAQTDPDERRLTTSQLILDGLEGCLLQWLLPCSMFRTESLFKLRQWMHLSHHSPAGSWTAERELEMTNKLKADGILEPAGRLEDHELGWKISSRNHWDETKDGDPPTDSDEWTPIYSSAMPSESAAVPCTSARHHFKQHSTCSLVGSSSSLLGRADGAKIDATDAVFRINYGPTLGFEADVGSRTDYRVGGNPENESVVPVIVTKCGQSTSSRLGHCWFFVITADCPRQGCIVVNPEGIEPMAEWLNRLMLWHARAEHFVKPRPLWKIHERFGSRSNEMSTGLFALVTAMTMCSHVDVYGFGIGMGKRNATNEWQTHLLNVTRVCGAAKAYTRYYQTPDYEDFDCLDDPDEADNEPNPPAAGDPFEGASHDFELEHVLLDVLHSQGHITRHPPPN